MHTHSLILAAAGLLLGGGSISHVSAQDYLWIEGEAATRKDVSLHPWWYDQVKKEVLSGNEWLHHFDDKKVGTAEYDFDITTAGTFAFWLRANPVASSLQWNVDAAAPAAVNFKDARGQQNIAKDNKPDLRFIAWAKVADVPLTVGKHTLKLRFDSGASHHGGIDCFCLSRGPFVPNGFLKPAAEAPAGPSDWFPLLADEDTFAADSVIDMTKLTHAPAGKFGRVQAVGDKLKFEKQPAGNFAKFWGCGANLEPDKGSQEQNLRRIRYLKKFGVNVVREHPLFDEISSAGKVDAKKLDAYDWWFAELKKAGIYTNWSVFYHFPIAAHDGYPNELFQELEAMGNKAEGLRDSYGLITISPQLWEIRTKVAASLLAHKNPYTGLTYAEDPALLAVELQNEDSVFFWNPLGDLTSPAPKKWPRHAAMLRQKFCAWVKAKYASDDAVKKAWGKLDGESLANGELALMGPWELDASGIRGRFAGQTQRAGDQIHFLTDMQREFYTTAQKALRTAGYQGITITTNWLGGSNLLDQANIYTDTVASMVDRHNYAGGGAGGHGITEGQVFAESHLSRPGSYLFSIGLKQVENQPFSMTEWTMCPPNQWKLEAAPIFAFYGMGLQGWDCSYHFAQSGSRLGDGWPNMHSYASDTPHYLGQFPALAFALQKGHIKEAAVVAARRTTPDQLYTGKPAWQQDFYNGKDLITAPGGTPLEIFGIGRVTVGFAGGKSEAAPLEPFWNKATKTLTSTTGELNWDYGKECITLTAPKTQAIIGKAGSQPISLPGVTATIKTPFVSLIFTPLDDVALAESKHILITALARDRQSGAEYSPDGSKLLKVGAAPLLLEPVEATLKFVGAKPLSVVALDHYGAPKKASAALSIKPDGSLQLDGTSKAYYYEVKR